MTFHLHVNGESLFVPVKVLGDFGFPMASSNNLSESYKYFLGVNLIFGVNKIRIHSPGVDGKFFD